ncbi:unnamed protein product [Effrenium voratum]|nr:unnamed protein product [Effrenium voratum]
MATTVQQVYCMSAVQAAPRCAPLSFSFSFSRGAQGECKAVACAMEFEGSEPAMGVAMRTPDWSQLDDNLRAAWRFLAFECTEEPVQEGPPLLPPREVGLTVVLDLDETLSHCRLEQLEKKPDFCVQFEESKATGYVYVRPFAQLFLQVAARLFEVVVFTASSQGYADQVLDQLDPDRRCISARLYRQHCVERGGAFLKDLRRLGRPMERVVLVDNSPVSLALCLDNGIVVSSWTAENRVDRELLELLLLLQQCVQQASVAQFLVERYGLRYMVDMLRQQPELIGAEFG